MMGWYNDSVGWGGWFAMSVMMVAFWGIVIFAVVAMFRGSNKESGRTGRKDQVTQHDPMRLLDERFARGEIDTDEYHARQAVLHDGVR